MQDETGLPVHQLFDYLNNTLDAIPAKWLIKVLLECVFLAGCDNCPSRWSLPHLVRQNLIRFYANSTFSVIVIWPFLLVSLALAFMRHNPSTVVFHGVCNSKGLWAQLLADRVHIVQTIDSSWCLVGQMLVTCRSPTCSELLTLVHCNQSEEYERNSVMTNDLFGTRLPVHNSTSSYSCATEL